MSEQTKGDVPRKVNGSPVATVNHGKVFGTKDWFTFYCGACGAQLDGEQYRCQCGVVAAWDSNIQIGMKEREG